LTCYFDGIITHPADEEYAANIWARGQARICRALWLRLRLLQAIPALRIKGGETPDLSPFAQVVQPADIRVAIDNEVWPGLV
jgi:hypothetical protein